VNNQYVYDGSRLDLKTFLSFSDVTDDVLSFQEDIPVRLDQMKKMLARPDAPRIQPSRHCKNPYECEFLEYCTRNMPEHWVLKLTGITQKRLNELEAMNIIEIKDIPESFPLTALQERIRKCVVNQGEYISQGLDAELRDVEFPVHFLDFETVSPVIPRYQGTKPYQTIPFQWSDHILSVEGDIEHREYICEEDKDPRENFARTLLDTLGNKGTIFIYTSYEKRIINELAEFLPGLSDALLALQDRFKDLQAITKKHFYMSEFHGSFSLKSVLPALIHDMSYKDMAVQEGGQASLEYLRMLDPSTADEEKKKIKGDLLTYCGYDTLAMVKIRDAFLNRFKL